MQTGRRVRDWRAPLIRTSTHATLNNDLVCSADAGCPALAPKQQPAQPLDKPLAETSVANKHAEPGSATAFIKTILIWVWSRHLPRPRSSETFVTRRASPTNHHIAERQHHRPDRPQGRNIPIRAARTSSIPGFTVLILAIVALTVRPQAVARPQGGELGKEGGLRRVRLARRLLLARSGLRLGSGSIDIAGRISTMLCSCF